jgi:hypothetical protein
MVEKISSQKNSKKVKRNKKSSAILDEGIKKSSKTSNLQVFRIIPSDQRAHHTRNGFATQDLKENLTVRFRQ